MPTKSVQIHNDLKNSYNLWNAWKPEYTFPKKKLDNSFLANMYMKETIINASVSKDDVFTVLIEELNLLLSSYKNAILLALGDFISEKSKLRTYKGLLFEIKNDLKNYSEFEVDLGNNKSVLGAQLDVLDNDLKTNLLFELSNSYIITSSSTDINNSLVSPDEIKSTLYLNNSICYIEFFETLKYWFNGKKDIKSLIRIGGDGDMEISIQEFFIKH